MRLKILLPTEILLDEEVSKVLAEGDNGWFCLLPNHQAFVSALVPGMLMYSLSEGTERVLAVDEGLLVKCGSDVLASVRAAVCGTNLGSLKQAVEEQFNKLDERERKARAAVCCWPSWRSDGSTRRLGSSISLWTDTTSNAVLASIPRNRFRAPMNMKWRCIGIPNGHSTGSQGLRLGRAPVYSTMSPKPPITPEQLERPYLRSSAEVAGYSIQVSDETIGHVEDVVVDDERWMLRYLEVDTRNWLPRKKVLVAPAWIDHISWTDRAVVTALSQDVIQSAPPYDPSKVITPECEVELWKHYENTRS